MENEEKAKKILKGKKFSIIGNFSYNDAFDAIIEMAEFKDTQRRTPSDDTTEGFVHIVIGEVACHETDLQRQIEQGKAFAESNKTVFDVAMAVAKFYDEQLQLRMDAYERERKVLAENKELRERIKHLEADLDEGGFNDLKKDILTLVNLIPCNDGNESVINDIKNLLK